MLGAHLLLDAVGPERRDLAGDVEPRLVDRVAERLARVAADDEPAGLRHERAQVPDRAADDDVRALQRDRAPRGGIAVDHEEAAVRVAPADWLALPSTTTRPDIMFSATPVPALPRTWTLARWFMPAQ